MFRPQFPMLQAPPGYTWIPCIYQYDKTNTPFFSGLALAPGQETGNIPLPIDSDVPFLLLAVKIKNTNVNVFLKDVYGNELIDTEVNPNQYASDLPTVTILEGPGIICVPGGVFEARCQGQ